MLHLSVGLLAVVLVVGVMFSFILYPNFTSLVMLLERMAVLVVMVIGTYSQGVVVIAGLVMEVSL